MQAICYWSEPASRLSHSKNELFLYLGLANLSKYHRTNMAATWRETQRPAYSMTGLGFGAGLGLGAPGGGGAGFGQGWGGRGRAGSFEVVILLVRVVWKSYVE
jgi:hypothetical protein